MRKRERKQTQGVSRKSKDKKGSYRFLSVSNSLILHWLDLLANAIYRSLKGGLFGTCMTAYSHENACLKDGFLCGYFTGGDKTKKYARTLRRALSEGFEASRILGWLSSLVRYVLSMPVRYVGNFLMTSGVYMLVVYFVLSIIPDVGEPGLSFLFTALSCILAPIPLLFSKQSIAMALGSSSIGHALLADAFGIRDETFDLAWPKRQRRANFPMLLGMLFGLLSFLVHPIWLLAGLGLLIFLALILSIPEVGVLASLFLLPFLSLLDAPSVTLALLTAVTVISFLVKLVRGKRLIQLEILDVVILIFMVTLVLAGYIGAGKTFGRNEAFLSCLLLLGYFLAVNLIRTGAWLRRCFVAVASSAVIVSACGIVQYVLGYAPRQWFDLSYFADIRGRVTSVFENPNYLAMYLVLTLPVLIGVVHVARQKKQKTLGWLGILSVLVCVILTWSRGAWVAVMIELLVYALIRSRRVIRYLVGLVAALPVISFFIPDSVWRRLLSIGDMADSSTFYRVYVWRGSARLIGQYPLGGIGYGNEAFLSMYPDVAYAGMEAANHSHSLYLQLLIAVGILGILPFAVAVFLFAQKNLAYFTKPYNRSSYLLTASSFCAVLGALVMGMFDYIWYNPLIFYLFWVTFGLSVASIRVGDDGKRRDEAIEDATVSRASVELKL